MGSISRVGGGGVKGGLKDRASLKRGSNPPEHTYYVLGIT